MSGKKEETYDYLMRSASSSDQTGLIPSAITSDAEEESYQNLYPYPPPTLKEEREQAKNGVSSEKSTHSGKRKINGHLSEQEENNLH